MKIAVVGGGYAGLASAFKLLKNVKSINIFDRASVGLGGASAVSAGLLHPLSPKGRLLWRGTQGYESTKRVLKAASQHDNKQLYSHINLLRPIIGNKQQTLWNTAVANLPEWLESVSLSEYSQQTGIQQFSPDILGAVRIRNTLLVDSPLYLQALWRAISTCDSVETNWHVTDCVDVVQLSNQFDAVILSCGADIDRLWSSAFNQSPDINYNSGSNKASSSEINTVDDVMNRKLNITLNESRNQLFAPFSADGDPLLTEGTGLLSGEYVIQRTINGQRVVLVGAAHKKLSVDSHFFPTNATELYDSEQQNKADADAFREMVSAKLHPSLRQLSPVGFNCGVKVLTPRSTAGRLPFVGRHPCQRNVWMIAGFGSRGLVHHVTAADILVEAILSGDESVIPSELSVKYVADKII